MRSVLGNLYGASLVDVIEKTHCEVVRGYLEDDDREEAIRKHYLLQKQRGSSEDTGDWEDEDEENEDDYLPYNP